MKLWLPAIFVCVMPFTASAAVTVASQSYVDNATADKVSTSATANQTMAGTYDVTGVMTVETPPLPPMP